MLNINLIQKMEYTVIILKKVKRGRVVYRNVVV